MKASPRQQQLLLDLQDLDNAIARLKRQHQNLPERAELAGLSDEAETVKAAYLAAQRELDAQTTEVQRVETDVAMVEQRRARDEQLLSASTLPKEAQALQGELDVLTRRQSELEERELELLEAQEAAQTAFAAAEREFNAFDERRAAIQAALEAAEQRLAREIASNGEERAGLAAEIQRDIIAVYEDLRGRIGIGAARLRGNVSEASNMALAPAELADILAAAPDELVFCPGTGAILVRIADEES